MCPGPAAPAPSPARPTMDISASIRDTWESPATPGSAAASSQKPGRGTDRGCGATVGRGRAGHTTAAASAQTSVSGRAMGRFRPREASFAAIAALPSAPARVDLPVVVPCHIHAAAAIDGHRGIEPVLHRGGDKLLAAPSLRALGEVDAAATGISALPDDDRSTVRSGGQRDGHRIRAPRRDGLGWRPGAVVPPRTIRCRAQCVPYLVVSQIELVPGTMEPAGAVNHQRRLDGVGDAGADDFRLSPPHTI